MNKQKTVSKRTNRDRTWKQIGPAVYIEPVQDEPVTPEWLTGQVSKVMVPLSDGMPVKLPVFFLEKIEASLSQAVSVFSPGDFEKFNPSPTVRVVRVRILVMDLSAQSKTIGLSDDRWGFFIVQKQGDHTDAPQLFLDLYLYQE